MRIITLGDIHGRSVWKDIVNSEKYDLIIFLGDYVSTHQGISDDAQINNLKEILDFKEANSDKVILLRGNHDLDHLGYYWAECSGHFREVCKWMSSKDVKHRFLNNTQWIYIYDNIIFSHAGISKTWLERANCPINKINKLNPSELFGFFAGNDNPFDYYGNSIYQSPVWIRPSSLVRDSIDKYIQVVGHTTYDCIFNWKDKVKDFPNIWLCDCDLQEYLVLDDGKFEIKKVPSIK